MPGSRLKVALLSVPLLHRLKEISTLFLLFSFCFFCLSCNACMCYITVILRNRVRHDNFLMQIFFSLGLSLVFQDGSKVFTASCDKTAKMWDLNSNQAIQIAQVSPKLLCSFFFSLIKSYLC